MTRLLWIASLAMMFSVAGCSKPGSTNVMENEDQAAIDAYDAQVAKDDAAMGNYKDIK